MTTEPFRNKTGWDGVRHGQTSFYYEFWKANAANDRSIRQQLYTLVTVTVDETDSGTLLRLKVAPHLGLRMLPLVAIAGILFNVFLLGNKAVDIHFWIIPLLALGIPIFSRSQREQLRQQFARLLELPSH